MAQFKMMTSGTAQSIESLGNTSQMKDIMFALVDIDAKNGSEAGEGGWKKVKEAFENFGFTICYDKNLALLTVALFDAIARSGNSDLKRDARIVIGRLSKSGKSLAQALLDGDGKAIYEILNCNLFKTNILKKIGISDEYIKKYLDRMKRITPWKLSDSKKALRSIAQAFEDMVGERVELEEAHSPQMSPVDVVERLADLEFLSKRKNKVKYIKFTEGGFVGGGTFKGFKNLKEVEFSRGLKAIWSDTFNGFSALEKVVIPNTVSEIGSKAFYECTSLKEITIPKSVKVFGDIGLVFGGCKKLKKVIMKCKVEYIPKSMFKDCTELTDIELPKGVKHINSEAFEGCSKLSKVVIPDGVESIRSKAFAECERLKEITIPNSVKEIGECAFAGCPQNMQILGNPQHEVEIKIRLQIGRSFEKIIGEYVELDETDTSKKSPVYVVKREEGLQSLAEQRDKIEYVRIAKGVDVPRGVFDDFKNLKEVELPSDLNIIGSSTFYGCSALKEIVIPNTVTSIGYGSFNGCESLEEIVIPESVKEFSSSGYAFANCKKLRKVIMKCKVEYIPKSMFENCTELTDIEIPKGVKYINSEAFKGCSKLSKVTIPDSVTEIFGGDYEGAFKGCPQNMQISGNPRPEIIGEITSQINQSGVME
ncbi:MAG: leucine-rich repeat domain-containing protein [Clostridia bacterium]|nr:leucine-rich repeat domain-containing protein [Clostridia bacterium]